MKSLVMRLFRGSSLRQRFLVAPLLGLVMCCLLTAAFVYASHRQNALLIRAEGDLTAFNRYTGVFVNLTEQHAALYDLLNSAGSTDEATLYDLGKVRLNKVQQAVSDLEGAMRTTDGSAIEFRAHRDDLSANARAYRKGVSAAVEMASVDFAHAPAQLAVANERFAAMSRSFVRLLEAQRLEISSEIAAGVRDSRIGVASTAAIGISLVAALFLVSLALSRILCRSIEVQVDILTDLGARAGASPAAAGGDEVERMAQAIMAFRQALESNAALTTGMDEMKRIDRMKTEFVSMVSHELRTPLTSIRGSLGLVAAGVAGTLPDAAKNLVDIAKSNCERLIRLINNILDTEKIESGNMTFDLKAVEIEPLIAQAIAANEGFARQHDVRLVLRAGGEAARVKVDSDGLSQVVTNLLSNAVKFSPAGATVEVVISRVERRVRVEVRDRGPGIAEEFRARIFQKFSQADSSNTRQKGGTGLGLNISKAIIERLGGTIGFATAAGAGGGTTFFLELPEWHGAPEAVEADRRPIVSNDAAAGPAGERARILHVEDDGDLQLITAALGRDLATFDFAATLQQARACLLMRRYDLIILDLNLTEGDGAGWKLVADIEALEPSPPIVVFSAADVSLVESRRVMAVLVKAHTSNDQLLKTIERILGQRPRLTARPGATDIVRAA